MGDTMAMLRTGARRGNGKKVEGYTAPHIHKMYEELGHGFKGLMVEAAVTAFMGASDDARRAVYTYINHLHMNDLSDRIDPDDAFQILKGDLDSLDAVRKRLENGGA